MQTILIKSTATREIRQHTFVFLEVAFMVPIAHTITQMEFERERARNKIVLHERDKDFDMSYSIFAKI